MAFFNRYCVEINLDRDERGDDNLKLEYQNAAVTIRLHSRNGQDSICIPFELLRDFVFNVNKIRE